LGYAGTSANGGNGNVTGGNGANGGAYGGGGSGPYADGCHTGGIGGVGAVRIIWAGTGSSCVARSFPSTNTGNL
jgi:hypothetical protein